MRFVRPRRSLSTLAVPRLLGALFLDLLASGHFVLARHRLTPSVARDGSLLREVSMLVVDEVSLGGNWTVPRMGTSFIQQ
jgi:hypothetical protein